MVVEGGSGSGVVGVKGDIPHCCCCEGGRGVGLAGVKVRFRSVAVEG